MKFSRGRVRNAVVVLAVVLAGVFALLRANSSQQPDTSPPSSGNPPTTTSTSTNPSALDAEQLPHEHVPPQLLRRVQGFMATYYLIKPADTEATRRQRIEPFGTAELTTQLDLGLSTGTVADAARVRDKLTLSGMAVLSQLDAQIANDNRTVMDVTVPVIVSTATPGNKAIPQFEALTTSRWQLLSGQWLITSFGGR